MLDFWVIVWCVCDLCIRASPSLLLTCTVCRGWVCGCGVCVDACGCGLMCADGLASPHREPRCHSATSAYPDTSHEAKHELTLQSVVRLPSSPSEARSPVSLYSNASKTTGWLSRRSSLTRISGALRVPRWWLNTTWAFMSRFIMTDETNMAFRRLWSHCRIMKDDSAVFVYHRALKMSALWQQC